MKILAYSFFFSGAILVVVGTMRAIVAKSLVQSLHYFGISDTIGLRDTHSFRTGRFSHYCPSFFKFTEEVRCFSQLLLFRFFTL